MLEKDCLLTHYLHNSDRGSALGILDTHEESFRQTELLKAVCHETKTILDGVADGDRTHDNRNHNPGLYH